MQSRAARPFTSGAAFSSAEAEEQATAMTISRKICKKREFSKLLVFRLF